MDLVDGSHQDSLIDDGFMFKAIDGRKGALWIRVGPVFNGNDIEAKPGVWINFQDKYMESPLQGELLLSAEVWDALDKKIRAHLTEYQSSEFKPTDEVRDCGCPH